MVGWVTLLAQIFPPKHGDNDSFHYLSTRWGAIRVPWTWEPNDIMYVKHWTWNLGSSRLYVQYRESKPFSFKALLAVLAFGLRTYTTADAWASAEEPLGCPEWLFGFEQQFRSPTARGWSHVPSLGSTAHNSEQVSYPLCASVSIKWKQWQ